MMFVGISKYLGNGWRVGVGGMVGKKKSAVQIAKEDKQAFLKTIKSRAKFASKKLAKQGYMDDSFQDSSNYIELTLRKIDDGGKLTSSNRDKLLDAIYNMEAIAKVEDHEINSSLSDAILGIAILILVVIFLIWIF